MKTCTKCKETKELSKFGINRRKLKDGSYKEYIRSYCNSCRVEYNTNHFKKYGYVRCKTQQKDYKLRSKYNITLDDFNKQLELQNNKCAICESEFKKQLHIHVDHCHTTNVIRGLLCTYCNTALGSFKDNITTLNNAIIYLKSGGSWSKATRSEKSQSNYVTTM